MDQQLLAVILDIAWTLIIALVGVIGWIQFFKLKERRLFKNVQRPIAIISSENKPMSHEADLLKRSGLFKDIGAPQSDPRSVDNFKGKRLIIIGYSPSMQNLKNIIDTARHHEIPVLVYAGPREIADEHMEILQSYTYYSMCNTPLRLVSDVFSVMSTTPEDK